MPELPEVESLRRGLERAELRGRITQLWRSEFALRTGQHWREENLDCVVGGTSVAFERHGKHLLWKLRHESEDVGVVIHLGMSGRLTVAQGADARAPHTHVIVQMSDGRELRFVDPRRFGGMKAARWEELRSTPPLVDLGVDALDPSFTGAYLYERAGASQRILRDVLLDQTIVAGIGNIYALEALFHARLHPLLRAARLRASAWERLVDAVSRVLQQGIRNGGTTFRDYRGAAGELGMNQRQLAVYGRAGLPCLVCGTSLEGFVSGGRSGAYCPHDQRRPRGRVA